MASAKVIESIQDLSERVGTAEGTYGFIQLPDAPKGPMGKPEFITSVDDLLRIFTTEGTIKPSYNLAFFEAQAFLQRANKLYVVRPNNGAQFGGLSIPGESPAMTWAATTEITLNANYKPSDLPALRLGNTAYSTGQFMRPSATSDFKFECTTAGTTSTTEVDFSTVSAAGQVVQDGTVTWTSRDMNHPTGFIYQCTTAGTTGSTEPTWPTTAGTTVQDGTVTWTAVAIAVPAAATSGEDDPEIDHEFEENETMFIYGKYPGEDNDNIGVQIYTYQNYPDVVKEPDAFLIEVYYRGTGQAVESFLCSRDLTKKDGYGINIYVENAVASSNYINVIDNPEVDPNVDPVDVIETTYLGGGFDGDATTDGDMMAGVDLVNNKSAFPIKLLMDGGWTTPEYQRKLNAIAESRKDCLALFSTPYSVEDSSSYTQEIVNYRTNTLNINSYWSALYTPHIQVYDQYNDRYLWIGPSSTAAGIISEISTNIAPWYPPAGLNRGVLNEVSDVKRRFDEPQMDMLCDNQINPVAFFAGEGVVLWGQSTLYSRPSALQDINVMLLITTIMPAIAKSLKSYLFEFNDDDTRSLITTMVDDYMQTVQTGKGIYDWQTNVHASDDDVDNGLLWVDLIIKPNKAIYTINFRIVPVKTGASFSTTLEILEG